MPEAPDLSRLRIDREPRASGGRAIRAIVVVALLLVAGWFGWRKLGPAEVSTLEVEVARVQRIGGAQAQSGIAANGYVVARQQAALSTDIQGRIVQLEVEEGSRVEEGDLIAKLDTTQLEAAREQAVHHEEQARHQHAQAEFLIAQAVHDREQARHAVDQYAAEIERATAARELAQREFDRVAALVKQGDLRRSELDRVTAELAQAEAAVGSWTAQRDSAVDRESSLRAQAEAAGAQRDAARSAIEAAAARVAEIDVQIHKSSVFAPFGGVITRKNAEIGEVVSAIGATGPNARGAVATLVDFSTLEVQVELAQTSLHAARPGAPVLIYLDAWPEDAYRGRMRQIWPTADRQKATVELRIEFLERDERILPEMGVRVVFTQDDAVPQPTEILVPSRAIVQGAQPAVFLFDGGLAVRRGIALGAGGRDGGRLVESGLQGNELVILDPPSSLRDGAAVRRRGAQ